MSPNRISDRACIFCRHHEAKIVNLGPMHGKHELHLCRRYSDEAAGTTTTCATARNKEALCGRGGKKFAQRPPKDQMQLPLYAEAD